MYYMYVLYEYEKNYKIILKYLQQNLNKLKRVVMFARNIENVLKKHIFEKKKHF